MDKQKKTLLLWVIVIICVFSGCRVSTVGKNPLASPSDFVGMKALAEDVVIGDTLVYENFATVKLIRFAFAEVVKPTAPAQFYTSYKVSEAGNVYAHLSVEIYNASMRGMPADDFFAVVLEDDGNHKNYTGFAVVDVENGSELVLGKDYLIPPLTTATVHLLAEVPKSVTTSGVPYKLQLKFRESAYRLDPDKTGGATYELGAFAEVSPYKEGIFAMTEQGRMGESVLNGEGANKDAYTVKSITFGNTVRPPNAAGDHINFALKEEGQTYAHVVVEYKNGDEVKPATEIKPAMICYQGYYSYTGQCVIEEPGGKNFTYPELVNVGSGETVVLHYMIPVPLEVQSKTNKVSVAWEIGADGPYTLGGAK